MIGKQLQNYTITQLIGEGGMAFVYLAINVNLGSKVAIKLLKEDFVGHPNIRKRFLAEAKNLAQMNHPNVIRVVDLIDAGDIVAFVMEYVEGNTLEEKLLKEGKLADQIISSFLKQMILAIDYVHKQGFIHRDIKPSNFLITGENQIKLLDFGIAKNTNDVTVDYTKTGLAQQMGTPLYMSPEQIKNTSEVTKQTDFYSLGVVLWQMVMGKKPYDSRDLSLPEIQVSILKEVLPLTNSKWDKVIQKATQKEETKRFQSEYEFLLALDSKEIVVDDFKRNIDNEKNDLTNILFNKGTKECYKAFIFSSFGFVFLIVFIFFFIKDNDIDNDGFTDDKDNCPNKYGLLNGCPDRDKDGFIDSLDICPNRFGTNCGCEIIDTLEFRNTTGRHVDFSLAYMDLKTNKFISEGHWNLGPEESTTIIFNKVFIQDNIWCNAKFFNLDGVRAEAPPNFRDQDFFCYDYKNRFHVINENCNLAPEPFTHYAFNKKPFLIFL